MRPKRGAETREEQPMKTVVGLFENYTDADRAVSELNARGFSRNELGALVGMGIPEEDANFYAEGVKRGGVLVTVQTNDDRAAEALNIMRSARAVDVDTQRQNWSKSGWSGRFDETFDPDDRYTWSDRARS